MKYDKGTLVNAKIRIDGRGDRAFTTYLRRELNAHDKKVMRDCKFLDSRSNVLIQMADMVAGTLRRSREKHDAESRALRALLRKHIADEWDFK